MKEGTKRVGEDDATIDRGLSEREPKKLRPIRDIDDRIDVTTQRKRLPSKRRVAVKDPGAGIRKLKCFKEIHTILSNGGFLREAIDVIHANGEWAELSRSAIRYKLKAYKDHLYKDESVLDGPIRTEFDEDEDPFAALYSMNKALRLITERIEMEVETEKGLTKLFSTTHREFLTQHKISYDILILRNKLGLLNQERGRTGRQRVGSGTPGRIDVAEVASNPESRQKVLGLVEALVSDPELLGHVAKMRPGDSNKKDNGGKKQKNRPKRKKGKKADEQ